MIVGIPKEIAAGERRVALTPDALKTLSAIGIEVLVQAGAGIESGFDDAAYETAGGKIEADTVMSRADVVIKVQPPSEPEIESLSSGSVLMERDSWARCGNS